MSSRFRIAAVLSLAAVTVLGAGAVAFGAAASTDVACTITDNTLTCPLPAAPAPVTETVTVTSTATATVTQTVTAAPTSTTATTTAAPTTTTTAPPATGFPTAATAGTPAGWSPVTSKTGDYTISTAGAVVEDLRVTNGDIIVNAANVTLRRVEVVGGQINNFAGSTCRKGLVVENSTVKRGTVTSATDPEAIGPGGYTAKGVELDGVSEGFRVGAKASCGAVSISDSYARVVRPDTCGDWHGDGIQGYDGGALTVRNTVIELVETGCGGTAPFFVPSGQGNTSVDIDGLVVKGGGYSFRLGVGGTVKNLNVVRGAWGYGPVDVRCTGVNWNAYLADLDSAGQPVNKTNQGCTGSGS